MDSVYTAAMKLEKRFQKIHTFLSGHQYLHEMEVLERYPVQHSLYHPWVMDILNLSQSERRIHENSSSNVTLRDPGYLDFLSQVNLLEALPRKEFSSSDIPLELKRKMSQKKQHELLIIKEQLAPYEFKHYIDIGSGAGHLSSYLLWNNQKTSNCIDMNSEFQDIGKKKLQKYLPELMNRIHFTTVQFDVQTKLEHQSHSALLGLHACGDLSVNMIKNFEKSQLKGLLNYGCCYHKLSATHFNLCEFASNNPLRLTNHSLTMAAKSYKPKSDSELNFREQVKRYRYGLHILLKNYFQKEFITIGNATKEDYAGSFATYARKYAPEFVKDLSDEELTKFIQNDETTQTIDYLQAMGIIRSKLARLIEIYIILDRALYLLEKGLDIEVTETFEPSLSPRNICLMAKRSKL